MTTTKKSIFLLATLTFLVFFSLAATAKEYTAQGTVNAIKSSSQKLTISHGPVEGLMGAMKMDFKVADPAMLSDVNVGSTIQFTLNEDAKGNLTIIDLETTEDIK